MNPRVNADGIGAATPWSETGQRARLLQTVTMVTHCVPAIGPTEAAWSLLLGYRTVESGTLGAAHAAAWDTPAVIGQRYCVMAPASGAQCWLRFIETGERGHDPPLRWGWTATELLAEDPDQLAVKLRGSAFRVLGGPGDLYPRPRAPRAMQTVGPSGELVYFTRLLPNGSRYGLHGARSEVDRPFIVTVGGPRGNAMHDFYGGTLGHRVMDRMPFINWILSSGCGAPPDTTIPTSVVRIPGRSFLVELDELPATAGPRPRRPGQLPPGMSMVSFRVATLDSFPVPLRAAPQTLAGAGYGGGRSAVIEGAAGEWLELIAMEAG
jgi:hypothetical protein